MAATQVPALIASIQQFLNRPYPQTNGRWTPLLVGFTFGLFVALFLWFFAPFDLHTMPSNERAVIAVYFGAITFGISLLNGLVLRFLFPNFFSEDNWVLGKEMMMIAWNFFSIGTGNAVLVMYFSNIFWNWELFWNLQIATLAVGAFPVLLYTAFNQNRLLQHNLSQAKQMTDHLPKKEIERPTPSPTNKLLFQSENGKDILQLNADQLLYITSSANYLEIHYKNDGPKKHLLRNRMITAEKWIEDHPSILRTHRAFIVNLYHLQQISGTAKGYTLHLNGLEMGLPVARSKSQHVEAYVNQLQPIHT